MKPVRVHPKAEKEADAAFDHYWEESHMAALRFDDELRDAYRKISFQPLICSPYLYGTRRAFLGHYPLSVIFRERLYDIQIIAVAHTKRRPGYWAKRLKQ